MIQDGVNTDTYLCQLLESEHVCPLVPSNAGVVLIMFFKTCDNCIWIHIVPQSNVVQMSH